MRHTNEKVKKRWIKRKKYETVKGVVNVSCVVLFIFLLLSIGVDLGCRGFGVLHFLRWFRPEGKENTVAAFNTVWSVAVTVTIFVLEISENYKYGVPLKRIIIEALGKGWLCIGVVAFLSLFPLFYVCMKFSYMMLGLWCLCAAFVMFTETVAFFAWMYRGVNIRKVVRVKTTEQIYELAQKECEEEKPEKKDQGRARRNRQASIHMQIDGLAISAMLDYTDYGNADEVGCLVDMCQEAFTDSELWEKLCQGMLENLIITTWIDHVIHSCKWNTEYDCIQNVNTLCSLWRGITGTFHDENRNAIVSICLQFLQPFIKENSPENDRILARIWYEFGVYRKQTLVYLLLYTTYLAYRFEKIDYTWILWDEFAFHICMHEIVKGYFGWDESFAIKCWMDWSRYDCREDIALTKFIQFAEDMKNLQRGNRYVVKSPILMRAVGGIE